MWLQVWYGMTIGEYALMINGEEWLENGVQCDLKVIPLKNYTQNEIFIADRPSPNLPNDHSINLYPSTCFSKLLMEEGRNGQTFSGVWIPYLKHAL